MLLRKIISGGQTGADQAGLVVAKRFGLETGGIMPKGWKTLEGPRPDFANLYGLREHASENYVPRTYENARDGDATVRLAGTFESRGEICTLKAIQNYDKPHFDVDLSDPPPVTNFVEWLTKNNVAVLNVAGNAEQTYKGSYQLSVKYLTEAFFLLGLEMTLTDEDVLRALGLDNRKIIYTSDRRLVDFLKVKQIGPKRV
jgi:hypothetical protein